MGYNTPPGDPIQQLLGSIAEIKRRVAELERPTGTQVYDALTELRQLVEDLPGQINAALAISVTTGTITASGTLNVAGAAYFPEAYANPVTVAYFAAYLNGDNRLGRTVSSRRYKRDIKTWTPDVQALFAARLVTYRQKTAVQEIGGDAPVEWGLIAEELLELGLDWLVITVDGKPEGIAYEKIGAALLPLVQAQQSAITNLDERLTRLENPLPPERDEPRRLDSE
jgi:hypothetical protein